MAVGPAGWGARGDPLTCTEAAVAVGLAAWANKNQSWYKGMIARNVCIGLFIGLAAFSLFSPVWLMLSLIAGMIGLIINFTNNPQNQVFPSVAITSHGWATFGPANHLISTSPSQGIDFSIYTAISERNTHNPSDYIEHNQLRSSSRPFFPLNDSKLSVTSLQALLESEQNYLMDISKTKIKDFRLSVLNPKSAKKLGDYIVSNFPPSANSTIAGIEVTLLDESAISLAQEQINWFSNVRQFNNDLSQRVSASLLYDYSPYQTWSEFLSEEGLSRSKTVLDSTQQGWANSIHGVDAAEVALERSVAADIIAQKEAVQRDMERTEEKIREKEAEFGIENARQQEQLEVQLKEIGAQVRVVSRQVSKIEALPIDSTIEMMTAYGVTSGGGGNFAVSTSVRREHYKIPNPAWTTREAIVEITKTEKELLIEKQKYVKVQIDNLDGAKERMMENLIEKKNEALKRLEESEKRATKAIRKDADEVRSLEQLNAQTNDIMRATVESFWLHPHLFLENHISKLSSISSDVEGLFERVKSSNDSAIGALRKSSLSQHGGTPLLHHWAVIRGDAYSDIRSMNPISFSSSSPPISINQGVAKKYLGVELNKILVQPFPRTSFLPALLRLREIGAIDPKLFDIVSKLKIDSIVGVS